MPSGFRPLVRTALSTALLGTLVWALPAQAQAPSSSPAPSAPTAASAASASAYLGLFRYDYQGGVSYEVRFESDQRLHWHCIAGEEKGRQAFETYDRVPLRDAQHLLSWTEADGLSVTQVIDFGAGTVHTVLTLPKGGERVVLEGRIRRL